VSSDPRLVVARRELRSLSAEKTIVLALLIQVFIAAFSSFLVVGLVSLSDPAASEVGVTIGVTGNATAVVTPIADDRPGVTVERFDDVDTAREAFRGRSVDAIVRVTREPSGRVEASATVPDGSLRTAQIVAQVREVLGAVERTLRARFAASLTQRPVPVPDSVGGSPYFGFTYTLLVPLLLFLPVFISGSIGVDTLAEEIERGTLTLLRVAPLDATDIVEGKLLAAVGIAPAQALVWMLLLQLNGTAVANVPVLLALVTGLAAALVATGAGLAIVLPDRQQAQFAYSVTVLVGLGTATLLLPEHPTNTVARLAVGSASTTSYVAAAGYVALGVVGVLVMRRLAGRLDTAG
jgi:ABC-type Na+ efflux pump permease subunit